VKRVIGYLVGLAVVLGVLALPVVFYDLDLGSDDVSEPTTITSYVADFDVSADGELAVLETLKVDFPYGGRHGIFRFFDRSDPSAPHARRTPRDIQVTMDGAEVPVELLSEEHGRYVNAKIGDPQRTILTGVHVFKIRYRIDGVLEEGMGEARSQFYWNLIPGGWRQPIESSHFTVHLPAPTETVDCAVGTGRADGCTVAGGGTDTLAVKTGHLDPNTPVTVRAGLDITTPSAGGALPWAARWDPVLGTSVEMLGLVLLLAVGAGVLGHVLVRRAREADPPFPLMYQPPDGIGPAQAAYVLTEDVGQDQYVATLMHAAEHGAVALARAGTGWTIRDVAGPDGWSGLDQVSASVAHLLSGPGSSFTAVLDDAEAGKRLREEMSSFEDNTRSWASRAGLMTSAGRGALGGALVWACFLLVVANAVFNPFDMTILAVVPGAFAVLGIGLSAPGAGMRRTAAGRKLWSRIGGFHRVLSTSSAEARFDFSGREERYTAYIPWAIAFGCADTWAEKYRAETASEPPLPSYLGSAYAGVGLASAVSAIVDDFDAAVSSAIASYEDTQSSSGGGGFSGGGGGGGGGGGSW
jgi:hypothetical protein